MLTKEWREMFSVRKKFISSLIILIFKINLTKIIKYYVDDIEKSLSAAHKITVSTVKTCIIINDHKIGGAVKFS